jgi:small subunit ribosomal protein S6
VRNYELAAIIAPTVEDADVQAVVDQVTAWLEADGGQVTDVNNWGRRQLAYSIQKFTEGTYVFWNTQLAPQALQELERSLKLDTNIIRYLLVRTGE